MNIMLSNTLTRQESLMASEKIHYMFNIADDMLEKKLWMKLLTFLGEIRPHLSGSRDGGMAKSCFLCETSQFEAFQPIHSIDGTHGLFLCNACHTKYEENKGGVENGA